MQLLKDDKLFNISVSNRHCLSILAIYVGQLKFKQCSANKSDNFRFYAHFLQICWFTRFINPDFFAGKICCLQISIQMLIFASAQHLISQLIVDGETGMLSKQNSPRRHTFFCTFYSLTLEVRGMNPLDF